MPPDEDQATAGLSGRLPRARFSGAPPTAPVPALTILHHPSFVRVGDRVLLTELLSGREALLSRLQPLFHAPGETVEEPLADPYLSRRPLRLRPAPDGGVTLVPGNSRTRLRAAGEAVSEERTFPVGEIRRGVVLELADRIVLLLHWLPLGRGERGEERARWGLAGESPGIARVRSEIRRVADLDVPVLLRGATGTGKELAARAIHAAGPRCRRPFVSVNLGALPPSLAASELFGSVKGAFTGSVQSREGYFRGAQGGILFLDEVGEAPPEIQVMLLRVLETGEVFPVGSQTPQRLDVRLIAATDADLEDMSRAGDFRAPLLYRLSGYEIWLPALAERRDDVGRLLLHFLSRELEEIGDSDRLRGGAAPLGSEWLPPELVARLARYDWPGNVRQLHNVVRQLVIGSRGHPRLTVSPQVERLLREGAASPGARTAAPDTPAAAPPREPAPPRRRRPSEVDSRELFAALREHRWNLKETAAALRISRPSLYGLIDHHPEVRKAGDLSSEEIHRCHSECDGVLEAMVDRLEVSSAALRRRLRELGLGWEPGSRGGR